MKKQRKRQKSSKKTGSVLVLVLLVVLISFIIGTGVLALGTQSRVTAINQVQDMMARSAADAGIERAVQEINNAVKSGKWSESFTPYASKVALGDLDSVYSVKTAYSSAEGYRIASFGQNRNRSRTPHSPHTHHSRFRRNPYRSHRHS